MLLARPAAGAGLALLLGWAATGRTSPHSGVDAQLYKPSFDAMGVFGVEGGDALSQHDLSFKIDLGYADRPLALAVPGIAGATDIDTVLDFALTFRMTAGFAISDRFALGFDAGLYRTDTGPGYGDRGRYRSGGPEPSTGLISLRPVSNLDPSGRFEPQGLAGPLDARLALKYVLRKGGRLSIAGLGILSAPFGDEEMFLGDRNLVFEPRAAVTLKLDPSGTTRLVTNGGIRFRQRNVLEAYDSAADPMAENPQAVLDIGSEVVAGAGLALAILPQLVVSGESTFVYPLPAQFSWGGCRLYSGARCSALSDEDYFADASYGDPAGYAIGGVQYRMTAQTMVTLGGGVGLAGIRREVYRVMSGITWTPSAESGRLAARRDQDSDGNPDATDMCPAEPEDDDGYRDEDGCPDPDNDGDGLVDASDACPDEPEDKDGFQDEDGCPERDNDGDGVADVTDQCPGEREDADGFEDEDGCPDEDNDGDGIPDQSDQCPNRSETVNGFEDEDGCPDQGVTTGPQLGADGIDLRGARIQFTGRRSTRLTDASQQLLDQIAAIIRANPNVIIRVEVHVPLSTQSRSRRAIARAQRIDRVVSQRRARTVFDYLVQQGRVLPGQLRADGIGSRLPIEQPPTNPINERIDFVRVQ